VILSAFLIVTLVQTTNDVRDMQGTLLRQEKILRSQEKNLLAATARVAATGPEE